MSALFIGVEVAPAAAADPAVAAALAEVCPVDIYARGDDGTLTIAEKQRRRVHALPPVPRRGARPAR